MRESGKVGIDCGILTALVVCDVGLLFTVVRLLGVMPTFSPFNREFTTEMNKTTVKQKLLHVGSNGKNRSDGIMNLLGLHQYE